MVAIIVVAIVRHSEVVIIHSQSPVRPFVCCSGIDMFGVPETEYRFVALRIMIRQRAGRETATEPFTKFDERGARKSRINRNLSHRLDELGFRPFVSFPVFCFVPPFLINNCRVVPLPRFLHPTADAISVMLSYTSFRRRPAG